MADDPLHNGSVPANELRQVQSLLWTVIVERLNPAEVDEVRVPSSRRRRRLSTHPLVPSTRDHPFPLLLSQVRRALGSSTIDENEQLMSEADALAEIIGDVRHRTDTRAHARRLYENPNRALVEGELRLLVRSIRRCASGDFADAARPPSARRERDISWSDIGNGGDAGPPSRAASELEPEDEPSRRAAKARADRLLASSDDERRLLEYVQGSAEALSIRAGTPRTPPSRPASSRPTTAGSSSSAGSFGADPHAVVDRYERNINAFDVDKVAAPLREMLAEERAVLLEDVEYLRECLEEEAATAARVDAPPPDVGELRRHGAKLRGVMDGERERAAHVAKVERMLAETQPRGRVGKLRTLAATLAPDGDGDIEGASGAARGRGRRARGRGTGAGTGTAGAGAGTAGTGTRPGAGAAPGVSTRDRRRRHLRR